MYKRQVSVAFSVDVDGQFIPTKQMSEAISLALQASTDTAIKLVADGQVTLSTQMATVISKQLDKQPNITFGHLLGLASINGADLGADITFCTIQEMQVNEFLLEFTIITPRNRILKVYVEDRTTIIDELDRTIIVGRQN